MTSLSGVTRMPFSELGIDRISEDQEAIRSQSSDTGLSSLFGSEEGGGKEGQDLEAMGLPSRPDGQINAQSAAVDQAASQKSHSGACCACSKNLAEQHSTEIENLHDNLRSKEEALIYSSETIRKQARTIAMLEGRDEHRVAHIRFLDGNSRLKDRRIEELRDYIVAQAGPPIARRTLIDGGFVNLNAPYHSASPFKLDVDLNDFGGPASARSD